MVTATSALVAVVLLAGFVGLLAMVYIWLERKVAARLQDRLGPTRVGGRFGWLQSIADGAKLMLKEDLIPAAADAPLYRLAPYIVMVGAFGAFLTIPFANGWAAATLDNAVFLFLALLSIEVIGVILAGYSSGSKWAMLGAMREAAQVVSYEVPMGLCLVIPLMVAGSMNLTVIAEQQQGWVWNWYLFRSPWMFLAAIVYFICATASCKRAPFDLAEAESELVAGFHTEYSGMRWSFFFLAEYAAMFAVSALFALLFMGGWNGPIPLFTAIDYHDSLIAKVFGVANFVGKASFMVLIMMWARWSLPRLRIDQVMTTCLKYLLPITCFLLLASSVWETFLPRGLVGLFQERPTIQATAMVSGGANPIIVNASSADGFSVAAMAKEATP